MTQAMPDDLWRDFPKTATEFEARFATEEDCRAYWIEARWGGEPACARCGSTRVWTIREGTTFECARLRPPDEPDVGHAAGEDAQAVQDVVPRGVRDLDAAHRHLGQGPAAHHGLRLLQDGVELAAQAARGDGAPRREPLGPFVQIDEALVGGKGGPHKELVLVAAEADGRVRLAHAENNDEGTLKSFADGQIAPTPRS